MRQQVGEFISYDDEGQWFEIFGVRYAVDLFRGLGVGPIGATFKVIAREDGVITLQTVAPADDEAAA